jgi:hypothetical protein
MTSRGVLSVLAAGCCVVLPNCSATTHGGPLGWAKLDANTWVQGSGNAQQRYVSSRAAFSGSLKDLASQETISVILRYPGARFVSSIPLAQCPAQAGLATFRSTSRTIELAFSAQNGQALTILYERPSAAKASDAAAAAMGAALCNAPV